MALTTWNVRKIHVIGDALVVEIVAEHLKLAVQFVPPSTMHGWIRQQEPFFLLSPTQTQATSHVIGFHTARAIYSPDTRRSITLPGTGLAVQRAPTREYGIAHFFSPRPTSPPLTSHCGTRKNF
jgi:hypothetical protein